MTRHWNDPGHGEPRHHTDGRTDRPTVTIDPCADHPTGSADTTDRFEVRVPTPEDGDIVVDVRSRRTDVVHRLLSLGVSHCTLSALLPEWTDLIAAVAAEQGETSGVSIPANLGRP